MSEIMTVESRELATPFQMDNPVFDTGQFESMMKVAQVMSEAKLVPQHLQKSPSDCLLVVEQSRRWNMSPFAVAQATSVVKGKLMFEGKLVTAVINTRAPIQAPLQFDVTGDGKEASVTVSATFRGEDKPRTYSTTVEQAMKVAGNSSLWTHDPVQQVCYFAARFWARRHCPEVILGVWGENEFVSGPEEPRDITPPTPEPIEIFDAYGAAHEMLPTEAIRQLKEWILAANREEITELVDLNSLTISSEASLALAVDDARKRLETQPTSEPETKPETSTSVPVVGRDGATWEMEPTEAIDTIEKWMSNIRYKQHAAGLFDDNPWITELMPEQAAAFREKHGLVG